MDFTSWYLTENQPAVEEELRLFLEIKKDDEEELLLDEGNKSEETCSTADTINEMISMVADWRRKSYIPWSSFAKKGSLRIWDLREK